MSKLSIYIIVLLTIFYGSIAYGADKPELDTETTLSIINIVMEYYYAEHHRNTDKIKALLLDPPLGNNFDNLIPGNQLGDEETIKFMDIDVSLKRPLRVGVVVRFSYGIRLPPWDDYFILEKKGNNWKIVQVRGLRLP